MAPLWRKTLNFRKAIKKRLLASGFGISGFGFAKFKEKIDALLDLDRVTKSAWGIHESCQSRDLRTNLHKNTKHHTKVIR